MTDDNRKFIESLKKEDWVSKDDVRALIEIIEGLEREINLLEPWQATAAESFMAIESYCRKLYPELPEHYGMPQDGVRKTIEYLTNRKGDDDDAK